MAVSSPKIDDFSDLGTEVVPSEDFSDLGTPVAAADDFSDLGTEVTPEVVAQEAQRASQGAVQSLDVVRAPQAFDWSSVREDIDTQRFQEAQAAEAQAKLAEEQGSGTGPGSEAFNWRREADFQRGRISPDSAAGRQLASEGRQELLDIGEVASTSEMEQTRTPSQLVSSFVGPGLAPTISPIVDSAARNLSPATGGALGAAMMLGGPAGWAGSFALPLIGGFLGSQVGGGAQETALRSTETPEETEARHQRAAEDEARNPGLSKIGTLVAQGPFFRPGLAQFGRAAAGDRGALANLGIAGTLGAGIEVASAAAQGRVADAEDIAFGAFSNLIMNEPTRLGRRLGFQPSTEESAAEAAQKYRDLPSETVPPVEADSGLTTRGTTSTADVFAGVRRPVEPAVAEAPLPPEAVPAAAAEIPPVEAQPEVAAPSAQETTSPIVEEVGRALPPVEAEGPTGIRNAVVDEQRRIAGLPAREQPLARDFPTIHEEAKAVLADDPEAGRRLVTQLAEEIRPLTDAEDAVLTFEQNAREQERTAAVEAVNNAKTLEERDAAQQRLTNADNSLFEIYQVGQNAGTENARGLNARKLMQNRDFTLSKMLNEKRAIENGGEPLTETQTKEVEAAHARIAELEAKLAETESKSAASEAQNEYRRILRETSKEAKAAGKAKEAQGDFLTRMRESAKARIQARRGRLQVTIDPLNIAGLVDEAIVGATYVAEGVRDFAKWSSKMVSEFGDRIKPQLEALFQKSSTLSDDMSKSFAAGAPETPEAVASRIKPGDKLEQRVVSDLFRAHINAGAEDFGKATAAVTQDLKKQFPSITERQVHDALSGYGKISTPSKEADLKKLREFKHLARLTSQLESAEKGLAPLKTGKQRDKATAEVRDLQKRVNDAMRRNGLNKTASERNIASGLDASKTRIKNEIEDLQRKIKKSDYEVPPKREPAIDREKIDLQFQLAKEKTKWQEGVIEAKRAKRSLGTKIWDSVKESANLSRALVTSMDLPPVFRQGLFAIGRPVMAAKAVKDALHSAISEKKAFKVQQEIENRPNAPLYEHAKLYLAKDTAQPLNRQEEAYMGNWFKKLPRWTVVGPALRASERTYNTFLNRIRADTFDAAVKAYSVSETDTATLKRLGDIINTMTGRATLPGKALESSAVGLNTFLFAPRFMASRFKLAVGEPLWTGNVKTRAFALEQYARTIGGAAVIYALAQSAGAEVETDPRSSNFGKIKIGSTYLDPLGGLSQVTTFLTRLITGETKTQSGKLVPLREEMRPLVTMGSDAAARGKPNKFSGSPSDVIQRFLRTKLNPVAGSVWNTLEGKDIIGQKTTLASTAKNLAVPISFQDIYKTMEKQGFPKGPALFALSLFGMGLQDRDRD